jgi:hypothetical protein
MLFYALSRVSMVTRDIMLDSITVTRIPGSKLVISDKVRISIILCV